MTVCIAAIAAESKAIVCIADRALTFAGATASTETDSGVTKIVDIPSTNWCAMFSGDDLTFPERVLRLLNADVLRQGRNGWNRDRIEQAVKSAFEKCWENAVEDHVLKPKLLSIASFTANPRDARLAADSQYLSVLAEEIANYRHNCSMIFCGFDEVGPHIFVASAPSQIDSYDWQGFQAIGAGEETARNHLIWSEYDKNDPLDSVLYDVFNAKVATEVLQGVGYAWDWRILTAGRKPQPISKRINNLIDRVWETLNRSPYAPKLSKRERAPNDWKEKLADYVKTVLPVKQKKSPRQRGKK